MMIKNVFVQNDNVHTIPIQQIDLKLLFADFTIVGRRRRRCRKFFAQVLLGVLKGQDALVLEITDFLYFEIILFQADNYIFTDNVVI